MPIYIAGQEYDHAYIAGVQADEIHVAGAEYQPASDTPGTLTVTASRSSGTTTFNFSITDPDGIRSLTSATLTARDSTTANVRSDFSRTNANTFGGTDTRRNARWNSGTLSVTYVDNTSGASHTLSQTWAVS